MAFNAFISTHQVFTTRDIVAVTGNPQAANVQLHSALKRGKIERVRRGVYVSRVGVFGIEQPYPIEIAHAVDPNAVFVYHTALSIWGVAHNLMQRCLFRSAEVREAFDFGGIAYKPLPLREPIDDVVRIGTPDRVRVRVASKEQTIVDALRAPGNCGGIEEAVRGCTQFAYVDAERVVEIARRSTRTNRARVGWLLEQKRSDWRIDDELLEELRSASGSGGSQRRPFVVGRSVVDWIDRDWGLAFPMPREEVESWISREG